MITINLLPYHLRPIKRTPLPYILSTLVLVLVLVALSVLWLQGQARISAKNAEFEQHKKELAGLQAIVDEFKRLSEQKTRLADKIQIIQDIVADRIIWSRQLFNISRLTPDNFWYSGIAEKQRTIKENRMVFNEQTGKEEMKSVTVPQRVLELKGYVITGADGSNDIYPLTFNMEQDPEFAGLFQLSLPKLVDTEFKGYRVRNFTLEYLVVEKKEEAASAGEPKQ
ncbi:MAG TPA: hypothetical protein P5318_04330 [Candidatus Hydrogenedentes bacterium]|nr:hypothetical protein [Candidatus Hydrogenedentota bacterium]HPC15378.1 hypothetical protein [Candidatus Hydrogenedentota bacterium]HRT19333.1 hypothetical protein [Candidatus Hydrogenedentota bacterium]HRT63413.1 hypothetical protein [Candidatus Hydrogenedentota bacterium]